MAGHSRSPRTYDLQIENTDVQAYSSISITHSTAKLMAKPRFFSERPLNSSIELLPDLMTMMDITSDPHLLHFERIPAAACSLPGTCDVPYCQLEISCIHVCSS